jgi:hypothetical protein
MQITAIYYNLLQILQNITKILQNIARYRKILQDIAKSYKIPRNTAKCIFFSFHVLSLSSLITFNSLITTHDLTQNHCKMAGIPNQSINQIEKKYVHYSKSGKEPKIRKEPTRQN